ncbi:ribosomal protein [Ceraceosorus bombacis]|uniref:Ribosomal protein n=1 Tax=Ceraceosorus bombacis TaxID=401625 RepID=A0A0P1BMW9_9BASI|nr:ribosomal protein [Ceraceosorus bombacis]
MAFKRYVQVGRVVLINQGPNEGKLAVIVEIIDHNRALVDGPSTGVDRQPLAYRSISLTPYVIKAVARGMGSGAIAKKWQASGVDEKFAQSAWAKKRAARQAKANTTDFDRFQIMLLKKQRRSLVSRQAAKIKA